MQTTQANPPTPDTLTTPPTPTTVPLQQKSAQRSWSRRWGFRLFVLVGLYGLTEAVAALGFRLLDDRAFSFSRMQRERRKIIPEESASAHININPGAAINPVNLSAPDRVYIPHPFLGTVLNPRYGAVMSGYDPMTEYGFTGKQNVSPVHKRSPNKVIVAITGGSVASMFGAQGTSILTAELQKVPAYAGKEFVFVNLGIPGHRQPQQIMALNYVLALGGEFDIVLNIDGFNEVALYPFSNWPKGAHPLFPIGWDRVVAEFPDPVERRLNAQVGDLKNRRENWARWFSNSPLRFCVTANLLWRARDRALASEARGCELALMGHNSKAIPTCAIGPIDRRPNNEDELFPELVSIWKRCSLQLARICRGHGIRYFHYLQPNQYVPGSKPFGERERRQVVTNTQPFKHNVLKGYPLLREAGRELTRQGVRFTDLTQVFIDHTEQVYIDDCCHVNQDGNTILAQAIARTMIEAPEPPQS